MKALFIKIGIGLFTLIFSSLNAQVTYTAVADGNWNADATWSGAGTPAANDHVIIPAGRTVTLNVDGNCTNATISGTLNYNADNRTLSIHNAGDVAVDGLLSRNGGGNDRCRLIFLDGDHQLTVNGTMNLEHLDLDMTNGTLTVDGSGDIQFDEQNNANDGNINLLSDGNTLIWDFQNQVDMADFFVRGDGCTLNFTANADINSSDDIEILNDNTHIINNGVLYLDDDIVHRSGAWDNTHIENYGTCTVGDAIYVNNGRDMLVENYGTFTLRGDAGEAINNSAAGANATIWHNYASSTLNLAGDIDTDTELYFSYNGNTVNYFDNGAQDIIIPNDGSYYHLHLTNGGDKDLTDNTIVQGDLVIQNNALLDVTNNNYSLTVGGDWINTSNAGFNERTGTVTLNGTGAQTINIPNDERFFNLIINNTGAGVTIVNGDVQVDGHLTLTDGVVYTQPASLLVIANNATSDAGTDASHVEGPMRKEGGNPFVFPVGDDGYVAQIELSNVSGAGTWQAEYHADPAPDDQDLNFAGVVSPNEYWDLDLVSGAGNADVSLYYWDADRSGIVTLLPGQIFSAQYDGGWNNTGGAWYPSSTIGPGGSGRLTFTPPGFGGNGHITFASDVVPLPVEGLLFAAKPADEGVNLDWTFSRENEVLGYQLERSVASGNYSVLSQQPGGIGTYLDTQPASGYNYYRLKVIYLDGTSAYSDIETVYWSGKLAVTVFPNPATDYIRMEMDTDAGFYVQLLNSRGQEVLRKIIRSGERLDVTHLAHGQYIVNVQMPDGQQISKRIVKQ